MLGACGTRCRKVVTNFILGPAKATHSDDFIIPPKTVSVGKRHKGEAIRTVLFLEFNSAGLKDFVILYNLELSLTLHSL